MIFTDYIKKGNSIYFEADDFDLEQTLDCGQAFRFQKQSDESFVGMALDKPLFIKKSGSEFVMENANDEDFCEFWQDYFDFNTDYKKLKSGYSEDEYLKSACEYASGIRLLKQNSWEALCSFIISQNNNIPRIKGIIERLCGNFGEETDYGFSFPTAKRLAVLSEDDLAPIKSGFRAKYILDAAKKVANEQIDLKYVKSMPIDNAREELQKIKGVGPKVAECALLFGMYRTEAFPLDVWMKKVMNKFYPDGFPACYEETKGIAQQYLFHWARTNLINF